MPKHDDSVWFWLKRGFEWKNFTKGECESLDAAFRKGQKSVEIMNGTVNLGNMTASIKGRKGERRVMYKPLVTRYGELDFKDEEDAGSTESVSSSEEEEEEEKLPSKPAPKPKQKGKKSKRKESEDDEEEEEEKPKASKPKAKAKSRAKAPDGDGEEEEKPKAKPKAKGKSRAKAPSSEGEEGSEEDAKPKTKGKRGKSTGEPPAKKQKVAGGKAVPKKGKASKKAQEELVYTPDITFFDKSAEPILNKGPLRATLELFRAAYIGDLSLFTKVLQSKGAIITTNPQHGDLTLQEYLVTKGMVDFLKAVDSETRKPQGTRTSQASYTAEGDSGKMSFNTIGKFTSQVGMGRGGKEGNKAFEAPPALIADEIMSLKIPTDVLNYLINEQKSIAPNSHTLHRALLTGNLQVARWICGELIKNKGWDVNQLHLSALSELPFEKLELGNILKISVVKKGAGGATPVHFACVNPNTSILKAYLGYVDSVDIKDFTNRNLVHYAAVCSDIENLKVLMEKGADFKEKDKQGFTPLMVAAELGRASHCKYIVELGVEGARNPEYANTKSQCYTALHHAIINNHPECIAPLINGGANPNLALEIKGRFVQQIKKYPLMLAAERGFVKCIDELLKNGADIKKADNKKRTALFYAAREGQTEALVFLLNKGLSAQSKDSSGNTVLHYAAGFGWVECCKYLVKAGADPTAESEWKTTPLKIALLKGFTDVEEWLIQECKVEVNGVDVASSLIRTCLANKTSTGFDNLKTMIEKYNLQVNIRDEDGNTPIHGIVNSTYSDLDASIIQYLMSKGCPADENKEGLTPVMAALTKGNLQSVLILLRNNAPFHHIDKNNRNILHHVSDIVTKNKFEDVVEVLKLISEKAGKDTLNSWNTSKDIFGYTPFLSMIHTLTSCSHNVQKCAEEEADEPMKVDEEQSRWDDWRSQSQRSASTYAAPASNPVIIADIVTSASKSEVTIPVEEIFGTQAAAPKAPVPAVVEQPDESAPMDTEEERDELDNNIEADPTSKVGNRVRSRLELMHAVEDEDEGDEDEQGSSNSAEDEPLPSVPAVPTQVQLHNEHHSSGASKMQAHQFLQFYLETIGGDINEALSIDPKDLTWMKKRWARVSHEEINLFPLHLWTPLHFVISSGRKDLAVTLISHGASKESVDSEGCTPFHLAVVLHNVELARLVSISNVNQRINNGSTAFHIACLNNDFAMVSWLFVIGGDMTAVSGRGCNAIHYLISAIAGSNSSFELLRTIIDRSKKEDITALINAKNTHNRNGCHLCFVDVNGYSGRVGVDPVETLMGIKSAAGTLDINERDSFGFTPLHYACMSGAALCITSLISMGANVNDVDSYGNTALSIVLRTGTPESVINLVNQGANVRCDVTYTARYRETSPSKTKETLKKYTTLYASLNNGWIGCSYILISKGFNTTQALEDACSLGSWQSLLSLICNSQPEDLAAVNGKGENLFHWLTLRGNDQWATDLGRRVVTRLGASAKRHLNIVSSEGYTPLALAVRRRQDNYTRLIIEHGGDVNSAVAPHIPAFHYATYISSGLLYDQNVFSKADPNLPDEKGNTVGHYAVLSRSVHTVVRLMTAFKVDFNKSNKNGDTPLMLAVKQNSVSIAAALLGILGPNCKPVPQELFGKNAVAFIYNCDSQGNTIIHTFVQSHPLGTVVNKNMLNLLVRCGAPHQNNNNAGKSPMDIAAEYQSPVVMELLAEVTRTPAGRPQNQLRRMASVKLTKTVLPDPVDVNEDSATFIKSFEEKRISEIEDAKAKFNVSDALVDSKFEYKNKGAYVVTAENNIYYHAFLNKTDVQYGSVGLNNFYLMQLIHHPAQNLYFLWTKWGRLGEVGQFQRTPVNTLEAGVKMFNALFKSKTANVFLDVNRDPTTFTRKQNLWNWKKMPLPEPEAVKYTDVSSILDKINWKDELLEPTKLSAQLYGLMKQMCDPSAVKNRLSLLNRLQSKYFLLGRLNKGVLLSAKALLLEIKEIIRRIEDLKKEGAVLYNFIAPIADVNLERTPSTIAKEQRERDAEKAKKDNLQLRLQKTYEEAAIKLNEYMEMIPQEMEGRRYCYNRLDILEDLSHWQRALAEIECLLDMEIAQKTIIAAIQHQSLPAKLNPFDYCYASLDTVVEPLPFDHEESNLIRTYYKRSRSHVLDSNIQIFKIDRDEDRKRFDQVGNGMLLWHGSHRANFISILTNGLRIAPPSAEQAGMMFGRGIYFADQAAKSYGYTRSDNGYSLMLLCEVAVGNPKRLKQSEYMESPVEGFQSTLGVGQCGPHPDGNLLLKTGVTVPLGEVVNYSQEYTAKLRFLRENGFLSATDSEFNQMLRSFPDSDACLQNNEYIVYKESQVRMRYLVLVKE